MSTRSGLVATRSTTLRISAAPIILVVALLLIFLRTPDILTTGRFWAEEGTIYFLDALLGSWSDALLEPRSGYFSSWTKIAALAASAVPLEWAPLVTSFAALTVQLAVVWIALHTGIFPGVPGKMLAIGVILFAPISAEVWLNTINSQFHFALGSALLLVSEPRAGAVAWRLSFLALAGTTGPVTAFLAPFFAWRAVRQPTKPYLTEAMVVGICALLQAWLMTHLLATNGRPMAFAMPALLSTLGIKLLAVPWFGSGADAMARTLLASSLASQAAVTVTLIALGTLLALVLIAHPVARLMLAVAVFIGTVSFAGALSSDPWTNLQPFYGDRYAYGPNALLGLALILAAMSRQVRPWRRIAAALLLAVFLVNGIAAYFSPSPWLVGPDWRAVVATWRADPGGHPLATWPVGWTPLVLPPELARQ